MILAFALLAASVGGCLLPLTIINRGFSRFPGCTLKAILETACYCLSVFFPVYTLWLGWSWGEQILPAGAGVQLLPQVSDLPWLVAILHGSPSVGWIRFIFLVSCWLTFALYTVVDIARHLRKPPELKEVQIKREILPFQPGPGHPRIWFPCLNGIYHLNRTQITLTVPGLDENLKGLRLGHLTDFHFGKYCHPDYIRYAVDTLMELEPEILVVTGDFVNFSKYMEECFNLLTTLHAPLGVYATCGNHDYWAGIEETHAGLRQAGLEVLDDRTVEVHRNGALFLLSGIESRWNRSRIPLDFIPEDPGILKIVLSHTPDEFPRLATHHPDLVLAGHTHGGQICFPFFGPVVVPSDYGRRYASGVFKMNHSLLYVSRGIGCYPSFRMLCDPEETLIEFV